MSDLRDIYDKAGSSSKRIWKLLAFVGRYGHQPVNVAMSLTVRDLGVLASQIGQIIEEENAAGGRFPGAD